MGKKTKKVIMFIVEGPTDEDTISPVIKRLFKMPQKMRNTAWVYLLMLSLIRELPL